MAPGYAIGQIMGLVDDQKRLFRRVAWYGFRDTAHSRVEQVVKIGDPRIGVGKEQA